MKGKITTIVIALFFVIGIGFIAYPIVGAIISDFTSTKVIQNYENQVKHMDYSTLDNSKKEFIDINKRLKKIVENPFMLMDESKSKKPTTLVDKNKKVKEGEMLGFLSIPKIDVMQPICEGTKEATLSHAIGHLTGTSMPYGGKSTHCCITGHSGLSYATMLSDLDKLYIGDVFYIKVLDETHEYKIDSKKIVKPYGADQYLQIEKGKDYVTLATCYPVTVNTHRLLLRGHRIPYDGGLKDFYKNKIAETELRVIILAIVALLIIGSVVTLYILRKKRLLFFKRRF